MRSQTDRALLWVRIAIPLLLTLLLAPLPQPPVLTNQLPQAARLAQAGQPAEAARLAATAAALRPWQPDLLDQAAAWALQGQDADLAGRLLDERLRSGQPDPRTWVLMAELREQQDSLAEAANAWRQAALANPGDADVHERAVRACLAADDPACAQAAAQAWLAALPEDPRARYQAGLALAFQEPAQAVPLLRAAAQAQPGLDPATRTLLNALSSAGRAADPAYQRILLGRGYASAGEWEYARLAFLEATRLQPGYGEAWALLGEARQHSGQNGWPDLDHALVLAPDSPLVRGLAGLYWLRQGEAARAVEYLAWVVEREPREPAWRLQLAQALAEAGRLTEAQAQYRAAIDLRPQDSYAWQALAAFSLVHQVDIAGVALPAAQEAARLAPLDPAPLDLQGQARLALSDLNGAEAAFQAALALDEGYAPAHVHLAVLRLQQGRSAEARALLEQALALDPEPATERQARRLLETYFAIPGTIQP